MGGEKRVQICYSSFCVLASNNNTSEVFINTSSFALSDDKNSELGILIISVIIFSYIKLYVLQKFFSEYFPNFCELNFTISAISSFIIYHAENKVNSHKLSHDGIMPSWLSTLFDVKFSFVANEQCSPLFYKFT